VKELINDSINADSEQLFSIVLFDNKARIHCRNTCA